MVIRDSDNEDTNKNEEINNDLDLLKVKSGDYFNNNNLMKKRIGNRRKTSMQNDYTFSKFLQKTKIENMGLGTDKIEINEDDEKENFQKTKLNVLRDNNKFNETN
jgi:hypothetical protein